MDYTKDSMINYIMGEVGCNEEQANAIYSLAYDYGHSNGTSEFYWYSQDMCDMINDFVRLW